MVFHASTVELWRGVPQSDNLQFDLKDSAPKIIKTGAQIAVQRSWDSGRDNQLWHEENKRRIDWAEEALGAAHGLCKWSGTGVQKSRKLAEANHKNRLSCETPALETGQIPTMAVTMAIICFASICIVRLDIFCWLKFLFFPQLWLATCTWAGESLATCHVAFSVTEVDLATFPCFVNLMW